MWRIRIAVEISLFNSSPWLVSDVNMMYAASLLVIARCDAAIKTLISRFN